ncbi:MAG: transglutaminase-like domain-containing protein [bacterium]
MNKKWLVVFFFTLVSSAAFAQAPPPDLAKDAKQFQRSLDKMSDPYFDVAKTAKKIRGKSAAAVMEWVRDNIAYEPYSGELRGAKGVLMDRRGNSVDQASLLVALFRAKGLNARFARSKKTPDMVTQLLAQFAGNATLINPAAITEKPGRVSDPTVNPRYASLIEDHVWAEVETKGVWVAADPVLAQKLAPAVLQATSRETELWDDLRTQVQISIEMELDDGQTKKLANWSGGLGELADGLRLTFNPHSRIDGALVPTLEVGDTAQTGDYFPSGGVSKMTAKVRVRRGMIETRYEENLTSKSDQIPVFSFDQAYFAFSFFNTFGTSDLARYQTTKALNVAADSMQSWVGFIATLGGELKDVDSRPYLNRVHDRLPHAIATAYITHYDALLDELAFGLGVRPLLNEPRFVTTALLRKGDSYALRVSVRDPGLDAMPRKGVPESAAAGFLTMAGRIEAQLQGTLLSTLTSEDLITVDEVFAAAEKSGTRVTTVDAKSMSKLQGLTGDKSTIRDVVRRRGSVVLTPVKPVVISGREVQGFWSLNPETGQLSGYIGSGLVSGVKADDGDAQKQPGKAAFALMKRLLVLTDTTADTRAHVGVVCAARADLNKVAAAFCATTAPLALPAATDCLSDETHGGLEVLSARPCDVRTKASRCGVAVASALLTGDLTALYAADGDPMSDKKPKNATTRAFGLTCK